jgi:acetylornithine deacetylase/succinyl-diaminopimelate desuccinylase-like protein
MVRRRQKEDPHFKADVFIETGTLRRPDGQTEAVKRFFPAWKLEPDNPVVKLGVRALQTVGLSGQVGYYAFCTNGSHSAGIAKIPTLGFGPSPEHLAHVADEYIAVSDLEKSCEGYQSLIHTYLMA